MTNAIAVAAGNKHSVALREDGTVVAWGRNTEGQTTVPPGLTNVVAIAARGNQSMALLKNGTVTNWGNANGTIPLSLTNAIAIACGTNFASALRTNGTVIAWGNNDNGQTNVPPGLTNVVAIAAGDFHAMALKVDGTVTNWGLNTAGQTSVPGGLSNVMALAAGRAHSVALKNDGTVVAWGDNSGGQTNIGAGLKGIKSIAAGGDHTLAAVFSSLVQYQVDVSKDLLLIYNHNTNSTGSSNIWIYYMQHRPMVGRANVFPIDCLTNEIITGAEFTNQFLNPMLGWWGANPTKRPQYVILFPDVPSTVQNGSVYTSLGFSLQGSLPGIKPFVTSINMRTTSDCNAYIDKLESIGNTYSPGKLIISASGGSNGYGNTNYYFDDTLNSSAPGTPSHGSKAKDGVLSVNPTASVIYSNGIDEVTLTNHIVSGTNVAGYLSHGGHSYLLNSYAIDGKVKWFGNSRWWIIATVESYNGKRDDPNTSQGNFLQWFSPTAFGGTSYENTPVGAVSHVSEGGFATRANEYFGRWEEGKNFGISAWTSSSPDVLQAVGDPFVRK